MVSDKVLFTVVMIGAALWVALFVAEVVYNHVRMRRMVEAREKQR